MNQENFEFLSRLLSVHAPSGFELPAQRIWAEEARKYAETVESDAYGNTFAVLNASASPRVLVAGHGDELGLMILHITDAGFLHFQAIGGVDPALLRGQRVVVHSGKGPVPGVIGQLAIHLQDPDDRKKVPGIHEMFIDIGAASKAEAEALVQVGDAATIAVQPVRLAGNRLAARGCDNRVGIWAAAEVLRQVAAKQQQLHACLLAASTIQEENGLYGATMLGYRLKPDLAIAVDVTHATDVPFCSKAKFGEIRLGDGPVITVGSSNHPVLVERFRQVAAEQKIPVQIEINPRRTSTDGDAFFLQRGGVPTLAIGLPNRYMHSPVEVIDLNDLQLLADLISAFVLSIKPNEQFWVNV